MNTFREISAMNTKVNIFIVSDRPRESEDKINFIEKCIKDFEANFSRFSRSSELSKLNEFRGGEFKASNEMINILSLSKDFYEKTNKIFDPTVLNTLENIGYDKNFNLIKIDDKNTVPFNSEPLENLKLKMILHLYYKVFYHVQ